MERLAMWLICPVTLFFFGVIAAAFCRWQGKRHWALGIVAMSVCWLYIWGTEGLACVLGCWLERAYPPLPMEKVPQASVIVLLGGGMGAPHGACLYPELFSGADRVWHAARLYHAGKAPFIQPSGKAEAESSVVLLKDLGVPADAIIVEGKAENTAENGRYTKDMMDKYGFTNALLVTSAFHMRRAHKIFNALGVQAFPVATDHEMMCGCQNGAEKQERTFTLSSAARLIPNSGILDRSTRYMKEILGYLGVSWQLGRCLQRNESAGSVCNQNAGKPNGWH